MVLIYFVPEHARAREAAHVLPQAAWCRHELDAARREFLVCAFFVDPKALIVASLFVKQEVPERWMVQPY